MRFGLHCILVMGILAAAVPAYAIDRGECGTPEAISAKLKAEKPALVWFGGTDRARKQRQFPVRHHFYGQR